MDQTDHHVTQHAQITNCLHISDSVREITPVVSKKGDVVAGINTLHISCYNKAHTIRGLKA